MDRTRRPGSRFFSGHQSLLNHACDRHCAQMDDQAWAEHDARCLAIEQEMARLREADETTHLLENTCAPA